MYIPGQGPSNAKICIVTDHPSNDDFRTRQHLSGSAGELLNTFLNKASLDRRSVYITSIDKGTEGASSGCDEGNSTDTQRQFIDEIRTLQPNIIVALGGSALQSLTNENYKINDYRGSILPYRNGGCAKVIGVYHPRAFYNRSDFGEKASWTMTIPTEWDFQRIAEESEFYDYNPPRRHLNVITNAQQFYRFLQANAGKKYVSVDIETWKTFPICVGLAFDSTTAVSLPLFNTLSSSNYTGMTRSDQVDCWRQLARLMADPSILKIGQNFMPFDARQLMYPNDGETVFGLKVNGFFFDCKLAWRVLYPELPANLGFIASCLTKEPYWKNEGKEYNPKKDKFDRLLLYNAKDAALTFEVFEKCLAELQQRGLEDFFFNVQQPLDLFYTRMEHRGILLDKIANKYLKERYEDKAEQLTLELKSYTRLFTDKDINPASPKQVAEHLKYDLKLPAREGTGEKVLDALLRNVVKDQDKRHILRLILEIRKVRKTIGTYINALPDHRGRILTTFNRILETGRTSTGILSAPVTTVKRGLAFQTITKHGDKENEFCGTDLRLEFIPDPGYVFIEPDLSQAEARVVALLANDEKLMKMFHYKVDLHRVTTVWVEGRVVDNLDLFFSETDTELCIALASRINRTLKEEVDDEQRQLGKKFRHAGHYDMGPQVAGILANVSQWKARTILDKFHETNPQIRGTFHAEIQKALAENNRTLVSPHGRSRLFFGHWGESLFKEAYAQIPQASVSDQVKLAMIRIERRLPYVIFLSESHDSFLAEVPLLSGAQYPFKMIDEARAVMKEELEQPIDFKNCSLSRGTLVIPCDFTIGERSWLEMRKM